MTTTIPRTIRDLERTIEVLRAVGDRDAVPPKAGTFFETFNGSLVFVASLDNDGDGSTVVLTGGHGVPSARGKKPGESYFIRKSGFYGQAAPGPEIVMSLMREVPLDIRAFQTGRPTAEGLALARHAKAEAEGEEDAADGDSEGEASLADMLRKLTS